MPKNDKKKEIGLLEIFARTLFGAIGWTIVYYVAAFGALVGLGGIAILVEKLKKAKK